MGDEIADVEVVMVRAHLKEIYESQEIKIRLSLLYVWYCSCFNICLPSVINSIPGAGQQVICLFSSPSLFAATPMHHVWKCWWNLTSSITTIPANKLPIMEKGLLVCWHIGIHCPIE